MKCPLLEASVNTNAGNLNGDEGNCLKQECAWYVKSEAVCSMVCLAAMAGGLVAIGDALLGKMPKEYQFRERG